MITNYKNFYDETELYLGNKASQHGVVDLNRYYLLNQSLPVGIKPNTLRCVLYHIAFESQDYRYGAVIGMGKPHNLAIVTKVLYNYDWKGIKSSYKDETDLYNKLDVQLPTLIHKGSNYKRYPRYHFAKRIWKACDYLSRFETYNDFKQDILCHNATPYEEAEYLAQQLGMTSGNLALACNILKEIDLDFDVAKPDVHIENVLLAAGLISTPTDQKTTIIAMRDLCTNIKNAGVSNINVFKLDRMLWLICSETFFYDDNIKNTIDRHRKAFLDQLRTDGIIKP